MKTKFKDLTNKQVEDLEKSIYRYFNLYHGFSGCKLTNISIFQYASDVSNGNKTGYFKIEYLDKDKSEFIVSTTFDEDDYVLDIVVYALIHLFNLPHPKVEYVNQSKTAKEFIKEYKEKSILAPVNFEGDLMVSEKELIELLNKFMKSKK